MPHIDQKFHDFLTYKDIDKLAHSMTKATVKCKCSRSVVVSKRDRAICPQCGNYVYRKKELEFKYKLLETINKKK